MFIRDAAVLSQSTNASSPFKQLKARINHELMYYSEALKCVGGNS